MMVIICLASRLPHLEVGMVLASNRNRMEGDDPFRISLAGLKDDNVIPITVMLPVPFPLTATALIRPSCCAGSRV